MKLKLILIASLVIAVLSNAGIYYLYSNSQKENSRLRINQTSLALKLQANEKNYSAAEFKAYQHGADSTAKANGIKTKLIHHYTKITEVIHDTIKLPLITDNPTIDIRTFQEKTDCYEIFGIVYPDTIELQYHHENSYDIFNYEKYNYPTFIKRLLHFDFDKFNSAMVISSCSGDTVLIKENIEIIRK